MSERTQDLLAGLRVTLQRVVRGFRIERIWDGEQLVVVIEHDHDNERIVMHCYHGAIKFISRDETLELVRVVICYRPKNERVTLRFSDGESVWFIGPTLTRFVQSCRGESHGN